jgi:Flp pilus assembly secretin CpaC
MALAPLLAFSVLLRKGDQLACVSFVRSGETMKIMASYVTGSRITASYVKKIPLAAGRSFNWLGLIAAMTVYCTSLPLWAMEETLVVTIDQARVVKVPPGTETLIVGNAAIADLTLLKQGAGMIVTGKGFGETNFIALDGAGSPLTQSLIRVVGGRNALLVQSGLDRQSYSCAPQCLPTAKLGDDAKYFGDVSKQVNDHNTQATGLK